MFWRPKFIGAVINELIKLAIYQLNGCAYGLPQQNQIGFTLVVLTLYNCFSQFGVNDCRSSETFLTPAEENFALSFNDPEFKIEFCKHIWKECWKSMDMTLGLPNDFTINSECLFLLEGYNAINESSFGAFYLEENYFSINF